MATNQTQTGIQNNPDGVLVTARAGKQGDSIVSELHGRFYEQNYRGSVFRAGMTLTSISNATFTSATTGATATPIVGLYNPITSGVNCVILQATLGVTVTALQATGAGPFVWMVGTLQSAISTGSAPFNARSLSTTSGGINGSGSVVKNVSGVALTGLSGAIAVAFGSALGGGSYSNAALLGTAAGFQTGMIGTVENFDGSLIVPPGGVIALMATTTPVAHSAASGLIWEEVPV